MPSIASAEPPIGAPTGRYRFYLAELDGVRCLAFFAVFLHHVFRPLTPARVSGFRWESLECWLTAAVMASGFSVDLFFALSSFLITSLLLREADRRGRIDVPAFWMRRILRIWPLYYLFLLICWLLERLPFGVVATFGLFAGNWALLVWSLPDSVIGPLWSISVEEQFYIAWPLVVALLPRKALAPLSVGLIGVSLVTRWVLITGGAGIGEIWVNTLARMDPIAIGTMIALAWANRRFELGRLAQTALGAGALLVVLATTALLWFELLQPDLESLAFRQETPALLAAVLAFLVNSLACGGLVVLALSARGSWVGHPVLVYLGRISYGLYVFHVWGLRTVEGLWWPWRGLLGFAITLGVASLSYRIFEQPFLRLKERFTYIPSVPVSGGEPLPEGGQRLNGALRE
jgi:peptidoglycan/LPS O-acetylase OafA/YrhL